MAVYMLGLELGLFSALLDMFRTRSPMFDRLQRCNNSHSNATGGWRRGVVVSGVRQ